VATPSDSANALLAGLKVRRAEVATTLFAPAPEDAAVCNADHLVVLETDDHVRGEIHHVERAGSGGVRAGTPQKVTIVRRQHEPGAEAHDRNGHDVPARLGAGRGYRTLMLGPAYSRPPSFPEMGDGRTARR